MRISDWSSDVFSSDLLCSATWGCLLPRPPRRRRSPPVFPVITMDAHTKGSPRTESPPMAVNASITPNASFRPYCQERQYCRTYYIGRAPFGERVCQYG